MGVDDGLEREEDEDMTSLEREREREKRDEMDRWGSRESEKRRSKE